MNKFVSLNVSIFQDQRIFTIDEDDYYFDDDVRGARSLPRGLSSFRRSTIAAEFNTDTMTTTATLHVPDNDGDDDIEDTVSERDGTIELQELSARAALEQARRAETAFDRC